MTCAKHNVRMLRLVLHGRINTREHAALLADVRHCPRCRRPQSPPQSPRHGDLEVPRAREEQAVRAYR